MKQWPLVVTAAVAAAGLVICAGHRPIVGTITIGAAFVFAGLARATLPSRLVGLLVVRGRQFDSLSLGLVGVTLVSLALSLR